MNYSLSFTAGALLVEESRVVAQILLDSNDSLHARNRILEQRLISSRTESSLKRTVSEILSRLATLPIEAIDLVAHGNLDEAKQALWIACCKKYKLIRNFAEGPLAEASRSTGVLIDSRAVEVFFINEQFDHTELAAVSEGTKYKLRQVLKLMLTQAGLVNHAGVVVRGLGQPRILSLLEAYPDENCLLGGLRKQ